MTTNYCDTDTCTTCHAAVIDTDQNGECRPCATSTHNLRLMAAGVTRDRNTGRYINIKEKK